MVNVHIQNGHDGRIISGSRKGDVRFWDTRLPNVDPHCTDSIQTINAGAGLTSFELHKYADVMAW